MIGDAGKSVRGTLFETLGRAVGRAQEQRPLPVDLLESDDAFLAVFDAPGAVSSDVQARFEAGAIRVRIDRFRDFYEGYEMQFPGRGLALDGHVRLPDDAAVDPEEASAVLKDNGTLHVRIPKRDDNAGSDEAGDDGSNSSAAQDEADSETAERNEGDDSTEE